MEYKAFETAKVGDRVEITSNKDTVLVGEVVRTTASGKTAEVKIIKTVRINLGKTRYDTAAHDIVYVAPETFVESEKPFEATVQIRLRKNGNWWVIDNSSNCVGDQHCYHDLAILNRTYGKDYFLVNDFGRPGYGAL